MLCPRCRGRKVDPEFPGAPCAYCWGLEPSCCDGPAGEPDETPTDPQYGEEDDDDAS
jgi:hypothetical protein